MARGKRPPNPLVAPEVDVLTAVDMIEAIGQGATIEPENPWRNFPPIWFGRVAQAAVEANLSSLRQGTVEQFRQRALNLVERALAEACLTSGGRAELATLLAQGEIIPQTFSTRREQLNIQEEEIWRGAALHCAMILRDVENARKRKGVKGRPRQSPNGEVLARLLDAQILWDAKNRVVGAVPRQVATRDAVSAELPIVVREYVRLGQLRWLGETEQECVDRHSKRLRGLLDNLVEAGQLGGSSIIRTARR